MENKEKDEIQQMFESQLKSQEEQDIIEEEEQQDEYTVNTHYTEIIGPVIALILGGMSVVNIFWFTAYFGIIFAGIGTYACKKKAGMISKFIVGLNIFALALCFFLGGLWLIMFVDKKIG